MKSLVGIVMAGMLFAACSSSDGGGPSGAICPTTNPPTYDSFGKQFMTSYCTGCHSSTASNRYDAPSSQNFDTEADIKARAAAIDAEAAKGPSSTNADMPDLGGPVKAEPSDAEREMLGQYLACLTAK